MWTQKDKSSLLLTSINTGTTVPF